MTNYTYITLRVLVKLLRKIISRQIKINVWFKLCTSEEIWQFPIVFRYITTTLDAIRLANKIRQKQKRAI